MNRREATNRERETARKPGNVFEMNITILAGEDSGTSVMFFAQMGISDFIMLISMISIDINPPN